MSSEEIPVSPLYAPELEVELELIRSFGSRYGGFGDRSALLIQNTVPCTSIGCIGRVFRGSAQKASADEGATQAETCDICGKTFTKQ